MDYTKYIGMARELLLILEKYFFDCQFLKTCFFITSVLLLSENFLLLSIIAPMDTIIKWIWILSATGVMYKVLAYAVCKIRTRILVRREEQKKGLEEQKYREQIRRKIEALSDGEEQILKRVLESKNGGEWVAKNDTGVLLLLNKGILQRISDVEKFADWENEYDDREICILVVVSEEVKGVLKS